MRNLHVTFYLIGAMTAIRIVQALAAGFTDSFVLVSSDAFSRPWILLTSIFLHGSVSHLLSNIVALGFFGFVLENTLGSRKFTAIFVSAGTIASIASLYYESSLGASGAIFGIIGALAAIRPRMTAFALGVPMPMFVAAALWALLDFAGVFYPTNVANIAHLAGLGSGIAAGFALRKDFAEGQRRKEKLLTKEELDAWEEEHMR